MLRQDPKIPGAGANQMKPTVPRANAKPKVVVKPKVDVAAKKPVVKPITKPMTSVLKQKKPKVKQVIKPRVGSEEKIRSQLDW